ncbi:ATP-binding protein [Streptomyces sp. NPDC052095]|uniref:ATP-binding protein n=1 Tax=unclassified Streptomyces TaxID=2593676 RepID=UPI00344BC80D
MLTTAPCSRAVWAEAAAPEPFAVVDDLAPSSLHFLAVPGVRTLLTPGMLAVGEALADACGQRRFLCVLGDAGVGKTFAVRTVARCLGAAVLLDLRVQSTPADLRAGLHGALELTGAPPADPGAADTLIRRALAATPRIVVVDDADRMSGSCLEYLRFLHDGTPGGLCVVLIAGQRGERHLRAQRMLATRTAAWLHLCALTRDQIPLAVPALHPLWQTVAPGHLQALGARFASGSLRRWVLLTHHTQRAPAATSAAAPDARLLQTVVDRIDSPDWRP